MKPFATEELFKLDGDIPLLRAGGPVFRRRRTPKAALFSAMIRTEEGEGRSA